MKKNKKLSEQPLEWPFDVSLKEYRKSYLEKERHTPLRNTDKFWFKKLFDSQIEIKFTLAEILFLKNELENSNISIFNFSYEQEEVEKESKNMIIGKLKSELDNNLMNPELVEDVWHDEIRTAVYDFTDEEYEQLGTY